MGSSGEVHTELALRPATERDRGRLLEWRNEPATVAASNGRTVAPGEHAVWLAEKLADPRCRVWIVEYRGQPVGQVRLDLRDDRSAEASIGLAPAARGRGLGSAAIAAAAAAVPGDWHVATLVARIKHANEASRRAFEKAGFVERDSDDAEARLVRAPVIGPRSSRPTGAQPKARR